MGSLPGSDMQYESAAKNNDDGHLNGDKFAFNSSVNGFDIGVDSCCKELLLRNRAPKKHINSWIRQFTGTVSSGSKASKTFQIYHYMFSSFLIIISIALHLSYLASRFYLYAEYPIETLSRPWLLVILLCECVYFCGAVLSAVDNLLPPSRRPDLGLLDITRARSHECPMVDVFLPCCHEPTDVPIESVKAALALDYPQDRFKVFVLDDGADDELRAFCQALQVETGTKRIKYIRRLKPKGVPHHFKCGNLNNGLKHSNADYVVMMDADMILQSSYLRRTLPHIVDAADVAFVQVPQSFYNLQPGDPLHDSCVLGYNRVLLHRDSLGTSSCVGTGTLFRRKHLDKIGGFQPQSITEDTMTAYMLFSQGYKSVYINEKLQYGITPWTFEGFVKQRTRWGAGAMQQFAASWKTCLGKKSKLNLVQKALYFYHTAFYFLAFNNAILATALLACLAFELKLSVGTDQQNLRLLERLAKYLITSRISWMSIWYKMPQAIQMRNRDESMFWWMTPYYIKMCLDSILHFKASFSFIPTSNIDNAASAAATKPTTPTTHGSSSKPKTHIKNSTTLWNLRFLVKDYMNRLKMVRFHVVYVILTLGTLLARFYHAMIMISGPNCSEKLQVMGLGIFFIVTCAHMLVPVLYVLSPRDITPQKRKSLLRYDVHGVPEFRPDVDGVPKWSWTVLPYEILSVLTLLCWTVVLILAIKFSHSQNGITDFQWCKQAA